MRLQSDARFRRGRRGRSNYMGERREHGPSFRLVEEFLSEVLVLDQEAENVLESEV